MMSAKLSVRPLFAAIAILSMFTSICLFTGAPLVNAQAEEAPTTEDRLENIEKLLTELSLKLENMHMTYVTREILGYELYSLKTELSGLDSTVDAHLYALRIEISALDSTVDSDLSALSTEMSALENKVGTEISSVKYMSGFQTVLLILLLSPYVVPPILNKIKKKVKI